MAVGTKYACIVCAAGRSGSRHHIMKHNGRQNLPMSTGCITTAITMQYNDKT